MTISIDTDQIGKLKENLLVSIQPETKKNDKKNFLNHFVLCTKSCQ